jgi:iron-sulfur cluster assembly protein
MAINVTEQAATKIRESLEREGYSEGGLRLGVRGGGCSGLNYLMRFEPAEKAGDKVFLKNGAKVIVDFKSLLYLKGMTLDWKGSLMQEGFVFENPNAKSTCSCGISFTV